MQFWLWFGFIVFLLTMLALDLGVLNRKAHVISAREAIAWTSLCATLALLFSIFIYFAYDRNWFGIGQTLGVEQAGGQAALQYLTGYIVELSLSLDNIFVIALIFSYLKTPPQYQHRVLFWGILGALAMRGVFIGVGAWLMANLQWMNYVFGAILLFTAARLMLAGESHVEPMNNPLVKAARLFHPVTDQYHGSRLFTRIAGKSAMTPLMVALLAVESADLAFAVDSIPAIFAITRDPFLVFTSNAFAILGLRSLYFALAAFLDSFRYLKVSLVFILAYIGVKMTLVQHFHIPVLISLGFILGALTAGVLASMIVSRREAAMAKPGQAAGFRDVG